MIIKHASCLYLYTSKTAISGCNCCYWSPSSYWDIMVKHENCRHKCTVDRKLFVSFSDETHYYNVYFTPLTQTRQNCLVRVNGVNWIGDKTRQFPIWVLFCLDSVSNLQLFSLKYIQDDWKLSWLVANSVHITDTDKTKQSCLVCVGGVK